MKQSSALTATQGFSEAPSTKSTTSTHTQMHEQPHPYTCLVTLQPTHSRTHSQMGSCTDPFRRYFSPHTQRVTRSPLVRHHSAHVHHTGDHSAPLLACTLKRESRVCRRVSWQQRLKLLRMARNIWDGIIGYDMRRCNEHRGSGGQ